MVNINKFGTDVAFVSLNDGPTKSSTKPSSSGGNVATTSNQSSIAQTQAKYPESTDAIHRMQQTLANTGARLGMIITGKKDEKIKEKMPLVDQFGLTQKGRELQSNDDGAWGPNTTKALQAVNKYIGNFCPSISERCDVGPYKGTQLSQVDMIKEKVEKNISILANLLGLEGDYTLTGGIVDSQELDELPLIKDKWKDYLQDGPIIISVANLNYLSSLKETFKNKLYSTNTSPAEHQVLLNMQSNSQTSDTFDPSKITVDDMVAYLNNTGKVITNLSELVNIEKNQIVPDFTYNFAMKFRTANPNIDNLEKWVKYLADDMNKWFDNIAKQSNYLINNSNIEEFYNDKLTALYNNILILFKEKDEMTRNIIENIIKHCKEKFTLSSVPQRTGKQYVTNELINQSLKNIKTHPESLMNSNLEGFNSFIAQRQSNTQNNSSNDSSNDWTIGTYKEVLNILLDRSQNQLKAIGTRAIQDLNNPFKSTFTKPIKEKYIALIRNLQNTLGTIEQSVRRIFMRKGIRTFSQSLLDGVIIPKNVLSASENALEQNSPNGRNRNSNGGYSGNSNGGSTSGSNGNGMNGGNFGSNGAGDYGQSGQTHAAPSINNPPVSGIINIKQLDAWARLKGTGGFNLDNYPIPVLSLSQFLNGSGMVNFLRNTFKQNPSEAPRFLEAVSQNIHIAVNNWSEKLQEAVKRGEKSQRDIEESLELTSQYTARWVNVLNEMIGELSNLRRQ